MATLSVQHISKSFGSTAVLRDVSVDIEPGEFFSLLGPSGCGKSTLLRIIAGLEDPNSGSIIKDGAVVDRVPPQRRGIGMVFQQYALWPHMTIGENVRFGLESLKLSRSECGERTREALERVQMLPYVDRYPHQISGGQQQRVALARALVLQPSIILLDEPLSNLDARLRAEIRYELLKLHRSLGTTMIYVTHDQEDALALSSRIAVMHEGRIEQVGTPREIYDRPISPFVAKFIGDANLVPCTVVDSSQPGRVAVQLRHELHSEGAARTGFTSFITTGKRPESGDSGYLCIRPAHVRVSPVTAGSDLGKVNAAVRHITYRGSDYDVELELADSTVVRAHLKDSELSEAVRPGKNAWVNWDEVKTIFLG